MVKVSILKEFTEVCEGVFINVKPLGLPFVYFFHAPIYLSNRQTKHKKRWTAGKGNLS